MELENDTEEDSEKKLKKKFSERQSRVFEQTERLKELKHKSLILAQDERWRRA